MPDPTAQAVATANDPIQLAIRGMTCAACVGRVERALRKLADVAQADVNFATEVATIRAAPGQTVSAQTLADAVSAAGYEAHVVGADAPMGNDTGEPPWRIWLPVALGLAAAIPLMLPMLWGQHHFWPAWFQFLLATPVQFILGARFYRAGWAALRAGAGNMDQLVALGTSAAWALSVWLWWRHPADAHHAPDLYFESSTVVIALVLLGKALEARAKYQTTAAIRALQALRPDVVHRLGPQGEVDVPLALVTAGDRLIVRPGERVPADGTVSEGRTHVDESLLTGEPLPVSKAEGDRLTGGAINGEGRLVMAVTAVGGQTMLSQIIRRVVDAQASKAPIQQLVDRVSAVFVPVVLLIAVLAGLGAWAWGLPAEAAVIRAVAVLVIACPCALGLATPAAIMAGTGAAARFGILIKDPQALELTHRIGVLAFDKTGTLTEGRPRVSHWQAADDAVTDAPALLGIAAGLQQGSEHPLARAVLAAAQAQGTTPQPMADVQAVPGRGIEGQQADLHRWMLGSTRWRDELGARAPEALQQVASRWATEGASVSWLMMARRDGAAQVQAVFAFGDAVKPHTVAAVRELHRLGVRTVMISGDNRGAAQAIGAQVGIDDVIAEVLPGDKADHVHRLQQATSPGGLATVVGMVGDGLNDAPALAAADVGLAMANPEGGTDVAMQAAGITLMRGDPMLIPAAIDISRRTSRKIRENLVWAFGYNVIGIPLAALGGLSPMLAGAAMAFSSVCVVTNALLLSRWRPPGAGDP